MSHPWGSLQPWEQIWDLKMPTKARSLDNTQAWCRICFPYTLRLNQRHLPFFSLFGLSSILEYTLEAVYLGLTCRLSKRICDRTYSSGAFQLHKECLGNLYQYGRTLSIYEDSFPLASCIFGHIHFPSVLRLYWSKFLLDGKPSDKYVHISVGKHKTIHS